MNNQFMMALGRHDGGAVTEALDDMVGEVTEAVHRTGKKGTITITMVIAPNGDRGKEVSFKAACKAPQLEFGKSFYFGTDRGGIGREAPKDEMQRTFGLRSVDGEQ